MRFGFCGGSYQSESPLADLQQSINFYPEQTENQNSRVTMPLYPTGGLGLFAALAGPSVRGLYENSGRTFAVSGTHLYELSSAGGILTDYGAAGGSNNIVDDGLPAVLIAGGTASGKYPGQLLIASGGTLTAFNLASNAFAAITSAPANVLDIDYLDGFFIALTTGNDWQVSAVEDCTTWSGLAISQVSVYSDVLLALIATNRTLGVFGGERAVFYYTSGNPIFPFDVISGGFLEVGIGAQYSPARVARAQGTTIMWLGGDERGGGTVYAAAGFTPTRVSDHALEYWLQSQKTISDAVGFATQENGHNFYTLWFPTANATWTLDADMGVWHRRSSLVNGVPGAHLGRCHAYAFGQHLVGDRNSGNVYAMSPAYFTDYGAPIIRTRIGPTVSTEAQYMFFDEFQVDFETGLGPIPPLLDANGNPRGPQAMFSCSKDFGKTWSNEIMANCGQAGNFSQRAIWRRLGKARSFTPKITVSDPIPWRISDAYINPSRDSQERLAKRFARMT